MVASRVQIPYSLVLFLLTIAIVNALAGMHSWYWTMRWFDMPMHFAGGAWLAFFGVWWYYTRKGLIPSSFATLILVCVSFAVTVGVLWEVYEGIVGLITVGHVNAWRDTVSDIHLDILGSLFVATAVWIRR